MEKKCRIFCVAPQKPQRTYQKIKEKITVPVYHNKKKQKRSHGEIKYDKITKKKQMKINKTAISHSIFIVNFDINVLTSFKPYLESEQIEKNRAKYMWAR